MSLIRVELSVTIPDCASRNARINSLTTWNGGLRAVASSWAHKKPKQHVSEGTLDVIAATAQTNSVPVDSLP